jgi:hypothetical protein
LQEIKIQAVEALVGLGWDINTTAGVYSTDGVYNLLVLAADKAQWRLLTWLVGECLGRATAQVQPGLE